MTAYDSGDFRHRFLGLFLRASPVLDENGYGIAFTRGKAHIASVIDRNHLSAPVDISRAGAVGKLHAVRPGKSGRDAGRPCAARRHGMLHEFLFVAAYHAVGENLVDKLGISQRRRAVVIASRMLFLHVRLLMDQTEIAGSEPADKAVGLIHSNYAVEKQIAGIVVAVNQNILQQPSHGSRKILRPIILEHRAPRVGIERFTVDCQNGVQGSSLHIERVAYGQSLVELEHAHKRIVRRIVDSDSVAAADNYRHAYSSGPVPDGFFKLLFQRVRMVGCGLMS